MLTVFHGGPSSRDWEKLSMLSDLFSDPWYFVESCASPVSTYPAELRYSRNILSKLARYPNYYSQMDPILFCWENVNYVSVLLSDMGHGARTAEYYC